MKNKHLKSEVLARDTYFKKLAQLDDLKIPERIEPLPKYEPQESGVYIDRDMFLTRFWKRISL